LTVRPSPGATVCVCPGMSIVLTRPWVFRAPLWCGDSPDDTVPGRKASGNIKK